MFTKEYTFYFEGFFGFGEKGDFRYFSLAHIIPIVLLILSAILVAKYKEKIRNWKYEEKFRYLLSFVMLIVEMSYFWRIMYVGNQTGEGSLMTKLPLQVCQWGLICCCYMVLNKNELMFNINFYLSLVFGVVAMITPSVIMYTGPTYYRYYQFWLEHALPVFATLYMMFVHELKPSFKGMLVVFAVLFVFAIICIRINALIPGANYMYLAPFDPTHMGDNITKYLPANLAVRVSLMALITFVLFNLEFFIYKKLSNKRS